MVKPANNPVDMIAVENIADGLVISTRQIRGDKMIDLIKMNSPYIAYWLLSLVILRDVRRAYLMAKTKTRKTGNHSLCQRFRPMVSTYQALIGDCMKIYSIAINAATPIAKLIYTFLRNETCSISSSRITFLLLPFLFLMVFDFAVLTRSYHPHCLRASL